jgi:hypothetical protein
MTNTFWIAGNIIFDLATGKTTDVFMLVNREQDATIFETREEAETALSFVQRRAEKIQWFLENPTPQRPQGWSVRGVQQTFRR